MYSHLTIGSNDIARARGFYDPVLATLGIERFFESEGALGYGALRGTRCWVMKPFDGGPAEPGNGMHVAFLAPTRAAVRAFHEAALAHGGSEEGAPGPRPQYHRNYYGAYVRDRTATSYRPAATDRSRRSANRLAASGGSRFSIDIVFSESDHIEGRSAVTAALWRRGRGSVIRLDNGTIGTEQLARREHESTGPSMRASRCCEAAARIASCCARLAQSGLLITHID